MLAIPKANIAINESCGHESFDWDAMERAVQKKERRLNWMDLSGLEDSVIVDQAKNGCR